jgi:cytochrome c-type biogenesis protein CcmH
VIAMILLLLVGTSAPDASMFVGAPQGRPLSGAPLEAKTIEIASLIRCPVCQGMSIADSPAEMAINMKHQVHALLERGYTQDQILDYFVRSYGQFVLLKPEFRGVNSLVWILPLLALGIGAVLVVGKMKRLQRPADPYLDRVRNLVSGGKP